MNNPGVTCASRRCRRGFLALGRCSRLFCVRNRRALFCGLAPLLGFFRGRLVCLDDFRFRRRFGSKCIARCERCGDCEQRRKCKSHCSRDSIVSTPDHDEPPGAETPHGRHRAGVIHPPLHVPMGTFCEPSFRLISRALEVGLIFCGVHGSVWYRKISRRTRVAIANVHVLHESPERPRTPPNKLCLLRGEPPRESCAERICLDLPPDDGAH